MKELKRFVEDESGMGVVEVILIIVVLVAMVAVFKTEIGNLVSEVWKSITKQSKEIYK